MIRRPLRALLDRVDRLYRRLRRLQPVGEALYVGRARHRGPALTLPDGTRVEPGAPIAELHFNNQHFAALAAAGGDPGRRFAAAFLASLEALAGACREGGPFAEVVAFHALSWLPPHGRRIGFLARPAAAGPAMLWRRLWFALLVWTYVPDSRRRPGGRPSEYWLGRRALLARFGGRGP
ncbi:MAG: hypothetical protein KatS3mg121_0332 [Gammaproteobacteria bacterium]|nr:MAG: hypothetical protein KatS3mg121_0332 [Gammaproteobacteria bacterium]